MLAETIEAVINAAMRLNILREDKLLDPDARAAFMNQLLSLEEGLTLAEVEELITKA
eukprot:CAMPEP_0181333848 /NCGR_PEP_ID=MMETSP1101-20121128/25918_1 /TAXON_ID=46948 /ORGANISM="Rhodomonas abbreviata, Strain Caron Lab Isolate" /LENGTH=56 /DNA_ID=CAMNT_0023443731 /DNA_START=88 /DNA_END=254 /DNA_ORIENTATION=+